MIRSWSVLGRLQERQQGLRNRALQAQRRMRERESGKDQPPDAERGAERDRIDAAWEMTPTVIALLFGFPDSVAIETLRARRAYFDLRTGDTWDLFFPRVLPAPTGTTRFR